jgi:hypothetical protein
MQLHQVQSLLKFKLGKGKSEVVPVLNSSPHHNDVFGSRLTAPCTFVTMAPDGDEQSPSRSGSLTPGKFLSVTYERKGWIGSRAGLYVIESRKIYCSCQ